ncbi:MAG: glycoside hydrolase family 3 C-terminal domain-containing protein [Treponema sp.]|nr:glycoside hydrolase family 3 C-terminal domain-containing protein [Treponema sp.]
MEFNSFERTGSKSTAPVAREAVNRKIARESAAEGMVLLQNDGVLPLSKDESIAIFGSGANHTIKGGTGSGEVNERECVTILEGLRNAGLKIENEDWLKEYDDSYQKARLEWKDRIIERCHGNTESVDFFVAHAENPFRAPKGRAIAKQDLGKADVAIYVVSRIAGEGSDRKEEKGDYYLSDSEELELKTLSSLAKKLVVLINTGAQIDMGFIHSLPNLSAIVDVKQPGMEGGNAVADLITGKVTPSGKLTATWAKKYSDFPGAANFSYKNGNLQKEYYNEGIFVGYRYFDAFGIDVDYPFGFGLSYTDFSIKFLSVESGKNVRVKFSVTNTGSKFAGKEVVQLYASCPQTALIKEEKRLVAFAKTGLLKPGESVEVELCFETKDIASFDEQKGEWVLEKGLYALSGGNSSADAKLCAVLKVENDFVVEKVNHVCPLKEELKSLEPNKDLLKKAEEAWQAKAKELGLTPVEFVPSVEEKKPCAEDEKDALAKKMAATLNREQLITFVHGVFNKAKGATVGDAGKRVPGTAGETTDELVDLGIPPVIMADGPAGVRVVQKYEVDRATGKPYFDGLTQSMAQGFFAMDHHRQNVDVYWQFCTAFPIGSLLAQTWDKDLIANVGKAVAVEMEEFHVSWWLAPGMNIQRNPLCGRNFEYFSEDPLVSGICASAMTDGVQCGNGTGTTIKHFACNNLEDNRKGSDSVLSERALREIYLRGFEIAIKKSQPMGLMTSYNLVNGVHSANNYDLCTQVARNEWGYKGMIMTDWTTTDSLGGSEAWMCPKVGNDLIMPGARSDEESMAAALAEGKLTDDDLRSCAERLINVILRTNAFKNSVPYRTRFGF